MVAAYKAATGVTLDITVLQADYRSVLTSKINSGDTPDIFMSSAYADNSTYKDYVYDLAGEDFIKNISPSALQGATVDGKVLGYPFLVQTHSFIYNKKVFADLGITTLPRTLAEFEAVSKKIAAAGSGIMFDSNQTIRVAKDGKNLQAALDWLRWLTTSEYGKNWIPGKIKQMSPIAGAAAPDSRIAEEAVKMMGQGVKAYPWFYQMFPTGTEQQLGAILQGYCAGITDRAATLDAMDAAYTKIAKAAN